MIQFDGLLIENIYCTQSQLAQGFQSFYQAIIYLECEICNISDVQIIRSYGVIELALINSNIIKLENITVQQSQKSKRKILHPSFNCIQQNLLPYLSFLIIAFYKEILIENLEVKELNSFNYPILQIQGYNLGLKQLQENIQIKNSFFSKNTIIIEDSAKEVSLIYINSNQKSDIKIQNVTFTENILHHYTQNLNLFSSTTILLKLQQGRIQILDCVFEKNLALNTSNSILFISSYILQMSNLNFRYNNQLLNSTISNIVNSTYNQSNDNYILFLDKISFSLLELYFPIISNGGNGYLIQNYLFIDNLIVKQSASGNGGSFYINTNGEGIIHIENSSFSETTSLFPNSQNSKGGCLYIDSSESGLRFTLSDSIINQTSSKDLGGAIYIKPSMSYNYIKFFNLKVQDTFSLSNSFFSLIYPFSQNIYSYVEIEQVEFYQTKLGFDQFLSKIQNILELFQTPVLININYGNVTIKNIILEAYMQQFLQIEQGQIIKISDIQIFNCSLFNSSIIFIKLNQNVMSQIIFQRFQLKNIQQKIEISLSQCESLKTQKQILDCRITGLTNDKTEIESFGTLTEQNQSICKKQKLFLNQMKIQSLIQIIFFFCAQAIIYILTMDIFQNQNICQHGIMSVFLSQQWNGIIKIKEAIITDNICGNQGCISAVQLVQQNNNNQRVLEQTTIQQELPEVMKSKIYHQLILEGCLFKNNTAQLGGALYLSSISCLIIGSKFFNNKANIGGSIYYISDQMQLQLINTQITNNIAQIAGGLFIQKLVLGLFHSLNVQIFSNVASFLNQDISENPIQLTISLDGGVTFLYKKTISNSTLQIVEKIDIHPSLTLKSEENQWYLRLPSGIPINSFSYFDESKLLNIPFNLTFRIIALNQFYKPEKQLDDSFCRISHKVIEILTGNEKNDIFSSISIENVTFNTSSSDFNLDKLIIYFNPQYSSLYFLRLTIECNMILIPIFDSNQTYSVINYNKKNYQLQIDVQTIHCQIGEYLNQETGGCVTCDSQQNLYSLINQASNCSIKDNELIDQFTSSSIQLKQFYWRAKNSMKIESCLHSKQNCKGGWKPGDDSCVLGHLGALCEQCDLYNIRGQGFYYVNVRYSCESCNKIVQNIIMILVIFTQIFILILLSVNSTVKSIEQIILSLRLSFLGFNDSLKEHSIAVYVKLFTNYLQIITIIQSFQLKIPDIIIAVYSGFGNPIQQMSYSWDCFLMNLTSIDANYFKIIWSIFNAFCILICFAFYQCLKQIIYHIKFSVQQQYTVLLYLFTFSHPSIIGMLISQVSYREISNIKWVQGNVSYRYYTETHKKWLLFLILPLLVLFGIIIPGYLFIKIYKIRSKLDKSIVKKKWGYLLNEYKKQSYFWDILKILQRQTIIVIFTYYENFIPVKASLVVVILFSYSLLQAYFQPYKVKKLNDIEGMTMKICSASILLSSCIYQAEQQQLVEIGLIFYFLITYCNIFLFCYFILTILQEYFIEFRTIFTSIKKFCPKLQINQILYQKLFQNDLKRRQKIKYYFSKIRNMILDQAKSQLNAKKTLNFTFSSSSDILHDSTIDKIEITHLKLQTPFVAKSKIYWQLMKTSINN